MSASLNLGIVAHVDAGKTSLTERLLFSAGAITRAGSVDSGTTRTDSMELERRRGITIRTNVTSFALGDLTINLVDTPGHPDFIAEVERSLTVLDAAVLVVSAVEGVQPQTVTLWRALQRIGVPTVMFVNKLDRGGADAGHALSQVRRRLTSSVVELTRVSNQGTRDASVQILPLTDEPVIAAIAETDDALLAQWVSTEPVRHDDVLTSLRRGVRGFSVTPTVCGSAMTGAGVDVLNHVLSEALPRPHQSKSGPPAGTVFAVDRDERGRRTWVRLWAGTLRVRDKAAFDSAKAARVTQVSVSEPGGITDRTAAHAGQIAIIRGPVARIGDTLGTPPHQGCHHFPPATLQALVEPANPRHRTALFAALTELADEDPLINLRIDPVDSQVAVSLHGEVQKEVIAALLEQRYGVPARFLDMTMVCLERVTGSGAAVDRINAGENPYLAGIGLRIEPAPRGHGVEFSPGVERGNLPPAFIAATEEGVRSALRQGLHGWEVTDCVVTMTESGYFPRQSKPHQKFDKSVSSVGADFRNLAPVVLMASLARAGTRVCQPVDRFELDVPDSAFAAVTAVIGRLGGATLQATAEHGYTRLLGDIPSVAVPGLATRLPELTSGEGSVTTTLDRHQPVRTDPPPSRRRTGLDPSDRQTWFRHVLR